MGEFAKQVSKMKSGKMVDSSKRLVAQDAITDPEVLALEHIESRTEKVAAYPIGLPRSSAIHDGCMRMFVIGAKEKLTKPEWTSIRSRLLWGYGNAYHFWVQNTGDVFGNRRVGWWKCRACGKVWHFGKPPAVRCKNCGASSFASIYHEHPLRLKGDYPCTGHPDMFLEVPGPLHRVVEIKTMNKDDFLKIVSPLATNEEQCQIYMWGCSQDRRLPIQVDSEHGYVLYICKAHLAKQFPFKMFHVKQNESLLDRVKDKLASFKKGYVNYPKYLPELHRECDRGDLRNWRAKQCVAKEKCLYYANEN